VSVISRAAALVALLFVACGGTGRGPVAPELPGADRDAVVTTAPPELEWGEPEPIAEGLLSEDFVVPLCAAVAPNGAVAVTWSDGTRGKYDVCVAESSGAPAGSWKRCRVGRSTGTRAPRPSLAFAPSGDLLVAWTAPWDDVGAASFAIRGAAEGSWSIPAPLDRHACGDVALATGPAGITAAFVRGVKRFSAEKLLGDFVHDPPLQPYDKIAIATLDERSWRARTIVDATTLLEAEQPRLCGDHLLLSRNGLLGRVPSPRDIVHVDLRDPRILETVARGDDLDSGVDTTALAIDHERVVSAFSARDGIRIRERRPDSWGDPLLVIPDRLATQPSLASTSHGLVLAAISRTSESIVYATLRDGRWSGPRSPFPAQSAIVFAAADAPLLLWCDGLPPIGPNDWNGHDPERFRRRLLLARPRTLE
jgi:hypothetical protein